MLVLVGFNHFIWDDTVTTPNYQLDFVRKNICYSNDYKVFRVLQTLLSMRLVSTSVQGAPSIKDARSPEQRLYSTIADLNLTAQGISRSLQHETL